MGTGGTCVGFIFLEELGMKRKIHMCSECGYYLFDLLFVGSFCFISRRTLFEEATPHVNFYDISPLQIISAPPVH